MKLLLDEQISGKVAERLSQRGHDVVAVTSTPRLKGLPDPEILAAAQESERAVVTYNRADFELIAEEYGGRGEDHHGLVIVHPIRLPNSELSRLVSELDRFLQSFERYPSFRHWIP